MVCPTCRKAGENNRIANEAEPYTDTRQWHRMYAIEGHQACKGGCDCAHQVGQCIDQGQPK